MQFLIEGIRKIVLLVLLMELVLQLQSGKQYEQYIRMLVGIMVVYSLISGILGVFTDAEEQLLVPMEEFQWAGDWFFEFEEQALVEMERVEENIEDASGNVDSMEQDQKVFDGQRVQVNVPPVSLITIDKIKIEEISKIGDLP